MHFVVCAEDTSTDVASACATDRLESSPMLRDADVASKRKILVTSDV